MIKLKKNCIRCKNFQQCVEDSFLNLDKYLDKRIIRKLMKEADFRYCKKFSKCSAKQEREIRNELGLNDYYLNA